MRIWAKLVLALLSMFVIWFGVGMMQAAVGPDRVAVEAAALFAFLSTLGVWLALVLPVLLRREATSAPGKAKRHADSGEDARLSLLIALMSEEERRAVRERLEGELGADGEAISLADLLAAQEESLRRRGG
jgi:hypothetical protein